MSRQTADTKTKRPSSIRPARVRRPEGRSTLGTTSRNLSRGFPGQRFCRTEFAQPYKTAWSTSPGEFGVTTIRVLPARHPEEPTWEPWRYGPDQKELSDFVREYKMWRSYAHSFVTYDSRHEEPPDLRDCPAAAMSAALWRGKENGEGPQIIVKLLKGSKKGAPMVTGCKPATVMQCLLYEAGTDRDTGNIRGFDPPLGYGDDDVPVLMVLSPQAGNRFLKLLRTLREGVDYDDVLGLDPYEVDDWGKYYEVGDPTTLDQGVFFRFFPEGGLDPRVKPEPRGRRDTRRDEGGKDKDSFKGYEVFCQTEPIEGADGVEYTPDLSEIADSLLRRVRPLDDVIIVPTLEEKVRMVVDSIRWKDDPSDTGKGALLPDVIKWGFRNYPHFLDMIPDDLAGEMKGRVSSGTGRRAADDELEEEIDDPRDRSADDRRRARDEDDEDEVEEREDPRASRRAARGKLDVGMAKARAAKKVEPPFDPKDEEDEDDDVEEQELTDEVEDVEEDEDDIEDEQDEDDVDQDDGDEDEEVDDDEEEEVDDDDDEEEEEPPRRGAGNRRAPVAEVKASKPKAATAARPAPAGKATKVKAEPSKADGNGKGKASAETASSKALSAAQRLRERAKGRVNGGRS